MLSNLIRVLRLQFTTPCSLAIFSGTILRSFLSFPLWFRYSSTHRRLVYSRCRYSCLGMSSKMVCDIVTVCAAASPRQLVYQPQLSSGNLLVWVRNWRHPVTSGQISYTCKITKKKSLPVNHCKAAMIFLPYKYHQTRLRRRWKKFEEINGSLYTHLMKAQQQNKSLIQITKWVIEGICGNVLW